VNGKLIAIAPMQSLLSDEAIWIEVGMQFGTTVYDEDSAD